MHISVVIPTVGNGDLDPITSALERQTLSPTETLIIHDTDRCGPAWARNHGFLDARGDLIAFLDDDCVPPPQWLEVLSQTLRRHRAHIVWGTYDETDPFLRELRDQRTYPVVDTVGQPQHTGAGGNMMVDGAWARAKHETDGYLFNPDLFWSEDHELVWQCARSGGRVAFTPLRVRHLKRVSPRSYLKLRFQRGASIYHFMRLIKETGDAQHVPGKSMVWDAKGAGKTAQMFKALLHKAFGPFDVRHYAHFRSFTLDWLGAKFEGLGFLAGRMGLARKGKRHPDDP